MQAYQWLMDHWGLILGTVLVIVNEMIAWNPNLAQNSIIQFILRLKPPVAPVASVTQLSKE